MSPNLYDLLNVEPTASDAEIRTAWKSAIADLDPSDRRFRAYNQAAEVLLDPTRRAAYDAELAAAEPGPEPGNEPDPVPAAPPLTEVEKDREQARLAKARSKAQARERRADEKAARAAAAGPRATSASRGVPTWLLAGIAAVTLLLVAATAYVWSQPSDTAVESATRSAQTAAEAATVAILSYDAATLEADQEAAQSFMTSDYREDYDELFEVLKQNAPETETKVEVEVISSGIVRSGEDRVAILLFVNRPTTNKQQTEPIIYKDQVTVTMERVGDEWLVDDMLSSPVAD